VIGGEQGEIEKRWNEFVIENYQKAREVITPALLN